MKRREFGQRVLQAAAALGLRSVSAPWLASCSGSGVGMAASLDGGAAAPPEMNDAIDAMVARTADAGASDAAAQQVMHEALLIGSGYGSAVTALRLTQKGIPVTILEMGRMWNQPDKDGKVFCSLLQPDGRAMWFQDHTTAVVSNVFGLSTRLTVPKQAGALAIVGNNPEMLVYVGRGVGGGSLTNLAMYITPQRDLFERVFPTVDAEAMFATYYPRAKTGLRVNTMTEDFFRNGKCMQYCRVAWEAATNAGFASSLLESGYDYAYLAKEDDDLVPRSATGFEATYGNNYGKRSLDKSYLADAMGTGLLTIHTLHHAKRITQNPDGSYAVSCDEIDIDGQVLASRTFQTRNLFLGGGSMGTSELLVRARETGALPKLNAHVGTSWGPNSEIFLARSNPIWRPTGTSQTTVPPTGFRTRDQDGRHVFSMNLPLPTGIENFTSMNIVMCEQDEVGSFRYDAQRDEAVLEWTHEQALPVIKSARFVFDKINVANDTSYRDDLYGGPELQDNSTYHPLGGCPLGRATDDYGRVAGYEGLYVVDGALIPLGVGANPSLTITALAERNIERVLQEDFSV